MLTKQSKVLSPNSVICKNERSFSNQQSQGLHHSTSNGHMTLVTNDIVDLDSEFNFRKVN
jgi:hypothetical protein